MLRYIFDLFFKKGGPEGKKNFNIKAMHNINRAAIILFLVAMVLLAVKLFS